MSISDKIEIEVAGLHVSGTTVKARGGSRMIYKGVTIQITVTTDTDAWEGCTDQAHADYYADHAVEMLQHELPHTYHGARIIVNTGTHENITIDTPGTKMGSDTDFINPDDLENEVAETVARLQKEHIAEIYGDRSTSIQAPVYARDRLKDYMRHNRLDTLGEALEHLLDAVKQKTE
jgi:hypothetical protein